MDKLNKFLKLNDIDEDSFLDAVHQDITELIFKKICFNLSINNDLYLKVKQQYFNTQNELFIVKQLVKNFCNCELLEEDLIKLNSWLKAFYKKDDQRKNLDSNIRKDLLKKQNYTCAICNKKLNNEEIRLDHIIPFDLVGDELDNNYQILCSNCNLAKSNHIAQSMFNMIIYSKERL